jgi:hypothetical protein
MDKTIFREAALERLSSPEELDRLMQITTPRGWLALVATGILLLAAFVLSLIWPLPAIVRGDCILTSSSGVTNLLSTAPGRIKWLAYTDDVVQKDQVIAQIYPSDSIAPVNVTSPLQGRILDIKVTDENPVGAGTPILSLEPLDQQQDLKAIIFLPPLEGAQVMTGALVQITPVTVKRETAGYIHGTVTAVSAYPSSPQGMLHMLGSEELVKAFSPGGIAPIKVEAALKPGQSANSYQWSTPQGSNVKLYSGTRCLADIVIKDQRPINLIFRSK